MAGPQGQPSNRASCLACSFREWLLVPVCKQQPAIHSLTSLTPSIRALAVLGSALQLAPHDYIQTVGGAHCLLLFHTVGTCALCMRCRAWYCTQLGQQPGALRRWLSFEQAPGMSALMYAGGTSNPLSSARCIRWQYVLRWRCGHSGSVGSASNSL